MERAPGGAPVLERGACYREFAPPAALADRVRALFSFTWRTEPVSPERRVTFEMRFADTDCYWSPLFADGSASLVFDFGVSLYRDRFWRDNGSGCRGKIIGPLTSVAPDVRTELPAMVGAYFRPGAVAEFAHAPAITLTDRVIPIEDLWGSFATDLAHRLATLGESAQLDLLEETLLLHGAERRGDKTLDIAGLAMLINRGRGGLSIESVADAAGVSRQHLTRVFRERVGVSPKLYSRLARFQSALVYARAGVRIDWARAAADLGYADQSHMIAEFREFSSLTPHRLATEPWFHPFIERAKTRAGLAGSSFTGRDG
jgi:AraC-like DNA-binding protein